jgi:hypothetical protein
MPTTIHSNGSKWAGQEPDTVEQLLGVLDREVLDRRFHGMFITREPKLVNGGRLTPGTVRFFGNFLTVSHVFRIDTDDADIIAKLTRAIRRNQRQEAYRAQPIPKRWRA